ncbi:MAG TPA: PQQ-binding-like beta-propeller repeat protein, partial [Longimicrobium sp.]|nr:PQQ-binding-like beta-propeller repeat protein [Longimicrobium sp.]
MPSRPLAAGLRLGAVLLAALLAGCGDSLVAPPGDASTALIAPPRGTVDSLVIAGAPRGKLATGATVQLAAMAVNSKGRLSAVEAKWRSADSTVARVSSAGVVTAVRQGTTAIIAANGRVVDSAAVTVVPAPATLVISSPQAAMYVGQRVPLTVTARDVYGFPVDGLYLAWTTSNPLRATVDSAGRATGAGVGVATLTVAAGTTVASRTLTVLARPVGEWSQAGAWATFQGNARHTGYVPVTADPVLFDVLWERTVAAGVPLNPVTTGDGMVFASTNAYFGQQRLSAFDVRTGRELWTKDFGQIHGVHSPAYGDGRVYVTTSGHQDSFLWGFDAATGVQRTKSPYGNQWSRYMSPVVADGRVYMAGGYYGGMYSFRTSDGGMAWFAYTNQYDEWTPAVDGGLAYAYTGEYSPALSVVNAATGAVAYEIPDPRFSWNGWSMYVAPVL